MLEEGQKMQLPEEGQKKSRKRRKVRVLDVAVILVFLAGLCIMLYPMASDYINRIQAARALGGYERTVKEAKPEDYTEIFKAARDYNRRLKENTNSFATAKPGEGYQDTLLIGNTGIMGYVMIEKIRVRLPFYHGTEEDVLQTAIGHVEGTSLPIGEKGDHAVLSAHRGLPSAKLFTDLPELAVGDTFVVTVLDKEMVYEVDQILTVLPDSLEAFEALKPVPGEDLVTLMTCTPYGVNTHRLLVRGHRTDNRKSEDVHGGTGGDSGDAGRSFDRYIPYIAVAAAVIFLVLWFLPARKKKR